MKERSQIKIEKEYRVDKVEEKWMKLWSEKNFYFNWDSEKPHYIIDTPPPYPTGSFHIGNTLNWCYIDFIARYKRMKGYEVMFPQGWDCHGLPTEVKVEEKYNISKNDIPRDKFRELCVEFTERNIEKMKNTMKRLGFSVDWSKEYITMYPEYFRKTQVSFVRMFNRGLIYREYHPVIHCPRCETTIALAEIEYRSEETILNYIKFEDDVVIATTRPELIPACVAIAVHPDDERYTSILGKEVTVPATDYKVRVIADEEVDPEFGTGVVMICTFGDRQDVKWWKKYNLDLRIILDKNGKLNEKAGRYAGLSVDESRTKIIDDLKAEGRVIEQKMVEHNVGVCWRCKTPVEIVAEEQWFVKIEKEKLMNAAKKVKWTPEHMLSRLEGWIEGMEWDWVISRQRVFATPIPVWYCDECGETMVAKEEWLPVDPTEKSPLEPCKCGSESFIGEKDVLDTWMDSSITPLAVTGWPDNLKEFPTHLRPQGHDIIRTWAFYTILRSVALVDEIPWYEIVINGMVLGEDGRKMSKSLGNIISPDEVVVKYGADALRQWAATGSIGSDVTFAWKEITAASRFQQKLWSILRFSMNHLIEYMPSEKDGENLRIADRWVLSELSRLIEVVDKSMNEYRFGDALKAIRNFTWYEFADNYIEIVKDRLYNGTDEEKRAGRYVLYNVLDSVLRLLAPVTPFITEECWSFLNKNSTIHLQSFPSSEGVDEESEKKGRLMRDIVAEVRRLKHDRGMALNAPLRSVKIYSPIEIDSRDISGAINSDVLLLEETPEIKTEIKELKPKYGLIGPVLRDKAKIVVEEVKKLDSEERTKLAEGQSIKLNISGEEVEVRGEWFEPVEENLFEGKDVEILEVRDAIVIVEL